jgi:hypothetical protein
VGQAISVEGSGQALLALNGVIASYQQGVTQSGLEVKEFDVSSLTVEHGKVENQGKRVRAKGRGWRAMAAKAQDRYGNQIELTDERWRHIVTYHSELEEFQEEVLETIRKGTRRQDVLESNKYKYLRRFSGLPLDHTHLVVVVKMVWNNFVLTAYGIEKKGTSR